MKMNDILQVIRELASSQGFYSRLYNRILELKKYNPGDYESLKNELESQNFSDAVDFILYVEG